MDTTTLSINKLGKLKVLIAEDNEISKLILTNMLHQWGFETQIASNGYEVIELMHAFYFDLVLMDIQMPLKDGIEATIEIRALEDEQKKNVPIIALTANAVKGEEKKYFEAGMNAYHTKPFTEKNLYELIESVLLNTNRKPINLAKKNTVAHSTEKKYSLNLVKELTGNNEILIKSVVETFITTVPLLNKELYQNALEKNWIQAAKIAHNLKSNIDTFIIKDIQADIRNIDTWGKQNIHIEAIFALVEKVHATLNECIIQLKEEFNL